MNFRKAGRDVWAFVFTPPRVAKETPPNDLKWAERGRRHFSHFYGIADVVVLEYISAAQTALSDSMDLNTRERLTHLFTPTIFLGAFLLFELELIIGKKLLPWFGGSPSVWTTCLVFFQVVLLGAYMYDHLLVKRLPLQRQLVVHHLLLAFSVILLAALAVRWPSPITPGSDWRPTPGGDPLVQLLALLAAAVGLPFFVLATTAPLLQSWFVAARPGKSSYWLYALSNAGSILGLLSFPFIVEPFLPLRMQATVWSGAYLVYGAGVTACMATVRGPLTINRRGLQAENSETVTPRPGFRDKLLWTSLAAGASGLLVSTTNHMCQDTAVVPLLWVLPLSLYLGSFILCFSSERLYRRWLFPPLLAASLISAVVVLFIGVDVPLRVQIGADAAVLFAGCMVCHGELSRAKPGTIHLTSFYLTIATGGALGGLCVAIVSPYAFAGLWEYHIFLFGTSALFLLALIRDRSSFLHKKPILIGIALGLFLTGLGAALIVEAIQPIPGTRFMTRNFYGVLQVVEDREEEWTELDHGRILHGFQYEQPEYARLPVSYFTKGSGLGLAITNHPRREVGLRIGVLGLGVGTIAAYCGVRDTICFYEINPAIIDLSKGSHPFFTYLKDCPGHVEVRLGDARLVMEEEILEHKEQRFDILALDAFSGDAPPVHLLTKEAFGMYLAHLRDPEGIIAVNISNYYVNLIPVVEGFARGEGLSSVLICVDDNTEGQLASDWILLSRSHTVLMREPIAAAATPWDSVSVKEIRPWTDDYSNLMKVLR